MSWKPLSAHFRQIYSNGFRYLDKCGEFMLVVNQILNTIAEDAVPTGAKLLHPEHMWNATVDATDIKVSQRFPPDDVQFFLTSCQVLAQKAEEIFGPLEVQSNGFAIKFYRPFASADQAMAEAVRLFPQDARLAKSLEMPLETAALDARFKSGSYELRIAGQASVFEKIAEYRHNAPLISTKAQRKRVDLLNKSKLPLTSDSNYSVVLDVDLIEKEPAANVNLEAHLKKMRSHAMRIQELFR